MLSEDDLIDILSEALAKRKEPSDWRTASPRGSDAVPRAGKWGFHVRQSFNSPWTALPMKRPFLSEHVVKQMVKKEKKKEIRIPASAILSPLAEEWLSSQGISVRREIV